MCAKDEETTWHTDADDQTVCSCRPRRADTDAHPRQSLRALRDIDKEGVDAESFGQVIFETFTTRLSDETQVELRPGGAATPVTFGNRLEYCELALHARLHESQRQCDALLQGLCYMVPQRLLTLFTWAQVER